MMKRLFGILLSLLLVSPALAQWQVPDSKLPVGRGAGITGFKSTTGITVGSDLSSLGFGVTSPPAPLSLYSSGGAVQLGAPNATRAQIVDGVTGTTVTTDQPSLLISRIETIASSVTVSNAALYAISVGTLTNAPQTTALNGYAYQLGTGDALGVGGKAEIHTVAGSSRAAIGLAGEGRAYVNGSSAQGVELQVHNQSGNNAGYFANMSGKQNFIGVDANYFSPGANLGSVGVMVRADTGRWDVGLGFNRFAGFSPTTTADIQTDSDALTILLANAGAHTNGINLTGTGSTYSGNAFMSPGFAIAGTGAASLGLVGGTTGTLNMKGSTSGTASIVAQAATNTPTLTLPNASGTFAISASSPVVLSATTGNLTCPTCVTSSGGGAISGTAPITVSAAGAVSLDAAGVTYAKIQNLGALAVMGRSANSSGVGADIQASAASDAVLRESGSTIGFGTIATGGIANNAVTLAKLATQATNTVLGNATSGTAVPTALAVGTCSTAASALIWTTNTGFGCNTSITAAAVPASGLTGATLASGVTASSLTSLGTITSLTATTINAFTLGGTIAGGGNQFNNIIIGTTTPLAGSFTALSATTSLGLNVAAGASFLTVTGNNTDVGISIVDTGRNNWKIGTDITAVATFEIYDNTAGASRFQITTAGLVTVKQTFAVAAMANVATTSAVCYNTATGLLTYDGTLGTCTVSDERLKNMGPRIDNALGKLLSIDGRYYTWKDPKFGTGRQVGVGAQTVERVFPELVSTDSTGRKSADYQRLAAPVIEALREIDARLVKLEIRK